MFNKILKEKCSDEEWSGCRVEKMGCDGCHYEDRPLTAKEQIFRDNLKRMWKLYSKKNQDYGDSVSRTFDDYGLTSFLVRMDDKINRLKTINQTQQIACDDEKIKDTLLDLANYAILAITEMQDRRNTLKESVMRPENDILRDGEHSGN